MLDLADNKVDFGEQMNDSLANEDWQNVSGDTLNCTVSCKTRSYFSWKWRQRELWSTDEIKFQTDPHLKCNF